MRREGTQVVALRSMGWDCRPPRVGLLLELSRLAPERRGVWFRELHIARGRVATDRLPSVEQANRRCAERRGSVQQRRSERDA
jgi:hypothetical protein